jgi:hypothetical protein
VVPVTVTLLKWYLVPPDFKDIHVNCSNFNTKVPSLNSEVLVDLKDIESPGSPFSLRLCITIDLKADCSI